MLIVLLHLLLFGSARHVRNLTKAWLNEHAAVVRQSLRNWGQRYRFRFSADGKDEEALAHSRGSLWEIRDVALRLWAVSNVHLVSLDKRSCYDVVLINTVLLADRIYWSSSNA
jgi:hypothetical protein